MISKPSSVRMRFKPSRTTSVLATIDTLHLIRISNPDLASAKHAKLSPSRFTEPACSIAKSDCEPPERSVAHQRYSYQRETRSVDWFQPYYLCAVKHLFRQGIPLRDNCGQIEPACLDPRCRSQSRSQCLICHDLPHCNRQQLGISAGYQNPINAIGKDVSGPKITIKSDRRKSGEHRFHQDIRKPFEPRRKHERVSCCSPLAMALAHAGHHDPARQRLVTDLLFE